MIQAKDLRIGNLVSSGGEILTVTELRGKHARVNYIRSDTGLPHNSMVEYSDLEGILLTEGWLRKFGFIRPIKKGSIWQLGKFTVQSFGGLGVFESRNHIEVGTVHNLQNLYHALTGEELTLQPLEAQ